jgi:hypothetical protein
VRAAQAGLRNISEVSKCHNNNLNMRIDCRRLPC